MAKTSHRRKRLKRQPQLGSRGAPSIGPFLVEFSAVAGSSGTANLRAQILDETGAIAATTAWTPEKEIDLSAIVIYEGVVQMEMISATVSANGEDIEITFDPGISPVKAEAIAGHPALIAANGQACGGAIGEG
jgi:hypothetical protein